MTLESCRDLAENGTLQKNNPLRSRIYFPRPQDEYRLSSRFGPNLAAGSNNFANFIRIHPSFLDNAPYFSSNKTFLVSNYISGFCSDILKELEKNLNFTTRVYKRRKTNWGQISKTKNGTVNASGVFADIYNGEIDLVLSPYLITLDRVEHVGYIKAVTDTYFGIFIPKSNTKMKNNWKILIDPFQLDLWIIIICSTLFLTTIDLILTNMKKKRLLFNVVEHVWTNFKANLGGAPDINVFGNLKVSYRIKIITSLLAGLIVWLSYQSSLTAELSVIMEKHPFHDPESFSKIDWRYVSSKYFNNMCLNIIITF